MEFNDDIVFAILNFLRENNAYDLLSFYYNEIPGEYSNQQIAFHLEYCRDNGFVQGQLSGDKIMAHAYLTPVGLRHLQTMDNTTTQPEISKTTATDLLTESVDAISELRKKSDDSLEFMEWKRDTEISISRIFGDRGRHLKEFKDISYLPSMFVLGGDNSEAIRRTFLSGLNKAEAMLRSMIREIEKPWGKDGQESSPSDSPSLVEIPQTVANSVFQENQFTLNERLAFMLSPFGKPFDTIFTNHIKPTVENIHELICVRADNIYDNQPVIDDIWRLTNEARIIIAELTGKNPNVFYETGLAHAIGKEVILITQSMDDVPFDLRHRRCIVYEHTPEGIDKLKDDLTNTITSILNRTNPFRPST